MPYAVTFPSPGKSCTVIRGRCPGVSPSAGHGRGSWRSRAVAWCPAQIVARELEVRLIDTICVSSYDEQRQREPRILKGIEGSGAGWLIVDDLVDTGQTGRLVREMLPEAHFATVYAKPSGRPVVDTFVTEVSQDTWILFPWDVEPKFAQPIITMRDL